MKQTVWGVALAALLALNMGGCAPVSDIVDTQTAVHIGFSNGELFEDSEEVFFTTEELGETIPEYAAYRSAFHFDTLSPDEQTVYTALEYAMERGYTNILVDAALIPDADTLSKILEFFALDSPLLEQNLRFKTGDFITYIPVNILDIYDYKVEFTGHYVSVDNFDASFWEGKQQAIEKAKEIVGALPANAGDAEKAEELFRYVAETVTYNDARYSEPHTVYPYLYDAFFEGETQCDGYTNAISLLYRLAGIECFEKNYSVHSEEGQEDESEEVGHTWNFARIGEKWYNVDGTGEDMIPLKETALHAGMNFGFGDMLQVYTPDYAEIYPKVEENLYVEIDAHLPDVSSRKFINAVETAYGRHNDQWALLLIDAYDDAGIASQLQIVANELQLDISYIPFDLSDGRTALVICDRSLFDKGVFG